MCSKISREVLLEHTTESEVFQDMDNFELLNDSSTFALSLRLQFPKFSKGFTSSDFEPFVRNHVGEGNLVSLGRLSFPNEWQMQVKNKAVRESLIRLGRTKINTRTCWITPLSQSEVRGYIHWIPTAVPNQKLETLLQAYGEILLMENTKQKFATPVASEARYFGLYLKSGKTMDDVPHFVRVEEYNGLITIRGRNPACFHCKELGHRKSECKKYREKVSDYSMRPPGSAKPRTNPRGKRHHPKKKDAVPKYVDMGVQTGEGIVTCPECRKEQVVVQKAAEAKERADAAEARKQAAEATKEAGESGGEDKKQAKVTGAEADTPPPVIVYQATGSDENELKAYLECVIATPCKHNPESQDGAPNKTKRRLIKERYSAYYKAKREEMKQDSSAKDSVAALKSADVIDVIGALRQKLEDTKLGPLCQLEQLKLQVEEFLAKTRESLEMEFEASKQMLLNKEAEKSAANVGDGKKKKRRKKKKKVVEVASVVELELDPSAV